MSLNKMKLQMFAKTTLTDLMTEKAVQSYFEENAPAPKLYPNLFPAVDVDDVMIEIIKNKGNKTTMAHVQPFGKTAHKSGREGVDKFLEKMDPIKEGTSIDERLYRAFLKNRQDPKVVRGLFDDLVNMYDAVEQRVEKMAMDAISDGVIAINDDGHVRNIDMQIPNEQQATITTDTDQWSDTTNSTPIDDLMTWKDKVKNAGRILTSDTILSYILRNDNVKKEIFGTDTFRRLTQDILNDYLDSLNVPPIATYDETTYRYNANNEKVEERYFPKNKLAILPSGNVGETQRTESVEQLSGNKVVSVRNMVALQQWEQEDPAGLFTLASAIKLPVVTEQESIFIAQPID